MNFFVLCCGLLALFTLVYQVIRRSQSTEADTGDVDDDVHRPQNLLLNPSFIVGSLIVYF